MKIRSDFVTNSSSVSYIITMHKDIIDIYLEILKYNDEYLKIAKLLKEDLLKEGTRCMIEGKEVYTKKIKFNTDETLTDETLENKDLNKMNIDDLWSYIFGEYILKGHLSILNGFGATQVETF